MNRLTISNTDLNVSSVCIGCWQFNGGEQSNDKTWPAQTPELSKEIVDKAIECGINFFDTAKAYLNSEVTLGKILSGRRRDVVIATKLGNPKSSETTAELIEEQITDSLMKLQTDYIDLYQIHWPHFVEKNLQSCVDELNRQKGRGRIRHIGVCNYGVENMKDIVKAGITPVTNQLSYSLLWRPIEYRIMDVCKQHSTDILCYSPLQQGLLSGNYLKLEDVPEGRRRTRLFNANSTSLCRHGEEGAEKQMFQAIADIKKSCEEAGIAMAPASLSWCLQQPPVKSVIVGASSPAQVEKNVQVLQLQQDLLQKLDVATRELKEHFGDTPDLWAHQSRIV